MRKEVEKTEQIRQRLMRELGQFIAPSRRLLEPLKDLSDKQMRAVVTLSYLMDGMAPSPIAPIVPQADITRKFTKEISTISPMLATAFKDIGRRGAACSDLTIEYLTKEKECEEKGGVYCTEASLASGNLIMCEMRQLRKRERIITDLWKDRLPQPPWPTRKPLLRKARNPRP